MYSVVSVSVYVCVSMFFCKMHVHVHTCTCIYTVHVHVYCTCTCILYMYMYTVQEESERQPLLRAFLAPTSTSYQHMETLRHLEVTYERTSSVSPLSWCQEFEAMNLPHFGRQYIQLVHIPLDVMHECLKLQLGIQLPDKPSPLSVKQVKHTDTHTHMYTI